nr:putative mfs-type transporter [Quercus suber]
MVFALIDAATPTWGPMNTELGFSYDILNDSYAIGCGTLAIGAFLLIPYALKFGRRPVYIFSTAVQVAISIWSAKLQTLADLMLVNALSCGVGALSEVIVQMTIADVFFVHERGTMNSIYGATDGAQVWWWCAIFFAVSLVAFIFTYEESKYNHSATRGSIAETVAAKPASSSKSGEIMIESDNTSGANIDPESGSDEQSQNLTKIRINLDIPRKTYWQRLAISTTTPGSFHTFARHSYQPIIMLFTFPAIGYMSLVYGVLTAWSMVMTVNLSSAMLEPPWNFNAAQIGLMSLPALIGTTLGNLLSGPLSDWHILWLAKRNNGIFEPEMRLWVMLPFVIFLPLGAFVFGYGLNYGWSWPVIAVAYAISNVGSAPIQALALTYVTDSYTEIIGDALVGVTFTRNVLGTIFVFALSPWIAAVGTANVYVTIGVIGIAVLLFVFVFLWKGKQMRRWTTARYRWYASRQFGARTV